MLDVLLESGVVFRFLISEEQVLFRSSVNDRFEDEDNDDGQWSLVVGTLPKISIGHGITMLIQTFSGESRAINSSKVVMIYEDEE